jgi:hypothetical protein
VSGLLSRKGAALVTSARFPGVSPERGHYESFYVKACHPQGGLGVWIRYTVHKRPGAAAVGALWFTLFDREQGVCASKVQVAGPRAGPGRYIELGEAWLDGSSAAGQAPSEHLDAEWELTFSGSEEPLRHLPRDWMYRSRLPRTKVLSPHPAVLVRGAARAGSREIRLDGWPGTVGHNWGAEHARRAIWVHGANFHGHERAWIDLAIGRVGVGPLTTPWIANGALSLDGVRHRLGGLERVASTRVAETPERCELGLEGSAGMRVELTVGAPRERFVGWLYAQPDGSERQTVNCSIADMELTVARPGRPALPLELHGGAAYELQMSERYPPIPLQPFPDG